MYVPGSSWGLPEFPWTAEVSGVAVQRIPVTPDEHHRCGKNTFRSNVPWWTWPCVLGRVRVLCSALPWALQAKRKWHRLSEAGQKRLLASTLSYSSNETAEKTLQRVPFLCSLWCSGLFWLWSSPLPQNRSLVLYSGGGVLMQASCSSFWLGKSWRPWAPWSFDHAWQIHSLLSKTNNQTKKKQTISVILWRSNNQHRSSMCPLSFQPWISSACWLRSPPARCVLLPPHTPLASPVSSVCVWSPSSKQTQAIVSDGANTHPYNRTTTIASVSYRVGEASIRAKAITAVIRWRAGGLHGYERGVAIAPQTHPDRWRLACQLLWIRFSRFREAVETKISSSVAYIFNRQLYLPSWKEPLHF